LVHHHCPEPFDLLLWGVGANSGHQLSAAWACVSYDRRLRQADLQVGAVSGATQPFAELLPFVQALECYEEHREQQPQVPIRVLAITDSEVIARGGSGKEPRDRKGCLWANLQWFEARGYQFAWQHVGEDSTHWQQWAKWLAQTYQTFTDSFLFELVRSLQIPAETPWAKLHLPTDTWIVTSSDESNAG
jgi:hypothetical protein